MDIFYTDDGYAYQGMDKDTIAILRTNLGKGTNFVDKTTFDILISEVKSLNTATVISVQPVTDISTLTSDQKIDLIITTLQNKGLLNV